MQSRNANSSAVAFEKNAFSYLYIETAFSFMKRNEQCAVKKIDIF
jgi:hypothetical protein